MDRDEPLVVVGAGSAGCVVAARVTERSDRPVVLLEAGPDYPRDEGLPEDLRDGTWNSVVQHDWGYRHRPTRSTGTIYLPRGRVVGGSSAVNTCIALRGQPEDYDEWAALGLDDWSWEKCLPAFKRLERDLDFGGPWHGTDGPVPIRRHPSGELVPWQSAFLDACASLGFPPCPDHNEPGTTGHGPQPMNKVDGERMSAARCYLTPEVRARDNLTVLGDAHVRRVLFRNRRVVGVELERGSAVEVLRTRRVVLCAGAFGSLGILLRSGIGPRHQLAALGVEQTAHLPAVGARLLDHPGAGIAILPRDGVCDPARDPLIQTTLRYTSERSRFPNDMQLEPISWLQLKTRKMPVMLLTAMVGKPRGHGRIWFTSADPHAAPRIESDFFLDPDDRARIVEAMEIAWLCASSPAMRELGWFLSPPERRMTTRADIDAWIPQQCGSGYHPCGTVPMGPERSADAAVDSRGRVRGVDGLTVADASIMPTIPTANTNLPTLMIGERIGAWLRDD
ncbi:MAG: GMC family oxidoreductase [Myxococcota bacterium]